mgnify:CR=1 FL=1
MPKKTRREKIIADYRNKLRLIHDVHLPSVSATVSFQPTTHQPLPKHSTTFALDPKEFSAIRRDLVKTVLLATIAIAAEFGLYWYWKRPA